MVANRHVLCRASRLSGLAHFRRLPRRSIEHFVTITFRVQLTCSCDPSRHRYPHPRQPFRRIRPYYAALRRPRYVRNRRRQPSRWGLPRVDHGRLVWRRNQRHPHTAWSGAPLASLTFRFFPADTANPTPARVRFLLVGAKGRKVTVSQGDRIIWSNFATPKGVWVESTDLVVDEFGRFSLTFGNDDPPWLEDNAETTRPLVFAVYDLELGVR
jgi:hypothetical protein